MRSLGQTMVSQALSVYSSSDGRRYHGPYHHPSYSYMPDRRFQLQSHDSRVMTMTDSQDENDSSSQRKRISVACGRCRKRKIRCSGDPGGGQPCSNCKHAGSEICAFLRVQSTEATLRNDPNEFSYNVQDGRVYRGSVSHGISYNPDAIPPVGASDMATPYRAGSSYTFASKPFYSALPGYTMGYVDDYGDYPIGGSSQPVMTQDLVPYSSWTSRGDYGYGSTTTSLVHRPSPSVATDSANFSLSSMAAHLPGSGSSDRLLPVPSNRSLPYTAPAQASYKTSSPTAVTEPSPVHAAAVLADMASGNYEASFDASALPYNSTAAAVLQAHAAHASRTNSEAYSPDSESIFTEHEHSLRSQGSAVDLNTYTYGGNASGGSSLQRASATSGDLVSASGNSAIGNHSSRNKSRSGTTTSSTMAATPSACTATTTRSLPGNQHVYMPTNSIHENHLPLAGAAAAVSGGTASISYMAEPMISSGGSNPTGPRNGSMHNESRRALVGGRR